MVELCRKTRFSAAHRYYVPGWTETQNRERFGRCALPHGHGHDYTLEVTVAGTIDPQTGMVVNITDLKAVLDREVVQRLDGEYLTPDHPLLGGQIPGTEVLAQLIGDWMAAALAAAGLPVELKKVVLAESRSLWAECARAEPRKEPRGDATPMMAPTVTLTRSYEFAAAHRLNSGTLTAAENYALFGKCNNPNGHGHNYVLEVTVGGEPDETGLLIDLAVLDRVVHEQVVDRYDHRHLNFDIEELHGVNPTSENVVQVIWRRLQPALPVGSLRRVTLRETERNSFTYQGASE